MFFPFGSTCSQILDMLQHSPPQLWEKTFLSSLFVSAFWVAVVGRGLMSARFFECPCLKMFSKPRQYWLPLMVLRWMIFLRTPAIGVSPCHCVTPLLVVPLPFSPEYLWGRRVNWYRSGGERLDPISRSRGDWSGRWISIQLSLSVVSGRTVTRLWWFLLVVSPNMVWWRDKNRSAWGRASEQLSGKTGLGNHADCAAEVDDEDAPSFVVDIMSGLGVETRGESKKCSHKPTRCSGQFFRQNKFWRV